MALPSRELSLGSGLPKAPGIDEFEDLGALLLSMMGLACAESELVWYGRTHESNFYYDSINIRHSAGLLERTPHIWRAWTIEDRDRPTAHPRVFVGYPFFPDWRHF